MHVKSWYFSNEERYPREKMMLVLWVIQRHDYVRSTRSFCATIDLTTMVSQHRRLVYRVHVVSTKSIKYKSLSFGMVIINRDII